MQRAFWTLIVALTPMLAAALPAAAGNYSGPGLAADAVVTDPRLGEGRFTGRYYFDRGGSRLDLNGRAANKSVIFNSFREYLITVSPRGAVNVDADRGGAVGLQFGDEPCAGFRKAISLGSESRGGRNIQVWRCERPKQAMLDAGVRPRYRTTVWYDAELMHFIRKEGSDGSRIELRNIVAGRQAPVLFEAPGDITPASAADRIQEVELLP